MANTFSELLAENQTDDYSGSFKAITGLGGSRQRTRVARWDITTAAVNDTHVLGTFKSGDRISAIYMSTGTATPTTGNIDLGLYKSALDHVPVAANLIDVDLFQDNQAVTTVVDFTEAFTDGDLAGIDRFKTLYELATVGAGSYTEDPGEDWDLVCTCVAAINGAQEILWEIEYIAAG